MIQRLKRYLLAKKVQKAIKQANDVKQLTEYKCFVLMFGGKPTVMKKRDVKDNIKMGVFTKGTTVAMIENHALYVTL
jgi:hypothetical protein